MHTEEYTSGTYHQTESERDIDRERMLALERAIRQHRLGTCYPADAIEWNKVWRIPFERTSNDLGERDFQQLRSLGASLSVKETFDGTEYALEMTKYRSMWRGWTRCQLATYTTSILGMVVTLGMLIYHVQSIH